MSRLGLGTARNAAEWPPRRTVLLGYLVSVPFFLVEVVAVGAAALAFSRTDSVKPVGVALIVGGPATAVGHLLWYLVVRRGSRRHARLTLATVGVGIAQVAFGWAVVRWW